jgi:4-amino-4-deoxy-L-arabinose transferase-like glycosyltransferase
MILFAQALLNALGVISCFYLGRQLVDRKTGITAAVIYAIFPEIAVQPIKLISEPLFTPAIIFAIYLFLKFKIEYKQKNSYKGLFWTGIFFGIVTLIKTTGSLVCLACFISLGLSKFLFRKRVLAIVMMGLGFFIATFPWNLRNFIVMEKPMMFTSNLGYNLWRGNHPWGSGTGHLSDEHLSEDKLPEEYRDYLQANYPETEVALDDFYFKEAINFIKKDPVRYIKYTLKRMLYFITIDPTHPLTKNIPYIGGYIFVLIFGIWGGVILRKRKLLDSVFIISVVLIFCFYTPIITLPRYRLILILVLMLFAAVPIAEYMTRVINRPVFKH